MLNRTIDFVLHNRWLIVGATVLLVAGGFWALYTVPVDAFPDLTNNQVVVVTECPSMSSTEVSSTACAPAGIPLRRMLLLQAELKKTKKPTQNKRFRINRSNWPGS